MTSLGLPVARRDGGLVPVTVNLKFNLVTGSRANSRARKLSRSLRAAAAAARAGRLGAEPRAKGAAPVPSASRGCNFHLPGHATPRARGLAIRARGLRQDARPRGSTTTSVVIIYHLIMVVIFTAAGSSRRAAPPRPCPPSTAARLASCPAVPQHCRHPQHNQCPDLVIIRGTRWHSARMQCSVFTQDDHFGISRRLNIIEGRRAKRLLGNQPGWGS